MSKIESLKNQNGVHAAWMFYCPACRCYHSFDERWEFNGNVDKPTFSPSLLVRFRRPKGYTNDNPAPMGYDGPYENMVCHSFVTDGRIRFLSDCTHELAGQTINMEESKNDTR